MNQFKCKNSIPFASKNKCNTKLEDHYIEMLHLPQPSVSAEYRKIKICPKPIADVLFARLQMLG